MRFSLILNNWDTCMQLMMAFLIIPNKERAPDDISFQWKIVAIYLMDGKCWSTITLPVSHLRSHFQIDVFIQHKWECYNSYIKEICSEQNKMFSFVHWLDVKLNRKTLVKQRYKYKGHVVCMNTWKLLDFI